MSARTLLMAAATAGPPGASLNLSFMSGTLDPRITFARASTATYFDSSGAMQTAASGAPRFDYDPVTHALRGLLIEEARTNLWLQSADASNVAWTKFGSVVVAPVVTANQTTAPDGTLTAARVVYPAVSGAGAYSMLYQGITATAAAYTFSAWLRGSVGGEQLYLNVQGASVYSLARITLTTQWQRYVFTTPVLTAAAWGFTIGTDLRDGAQTTTPGGTVFVWGAQVELGAFPTSYIPTTAAAVTRAMDQAYIPTAAWFNSATYSIAVEFDTGLATSIVSGIADTNSSNGSYIGNGAFSRTGAAGAAIGTPYPTVGAAMKMCGTLNAATLQCCTNGGAIGSNGNGAALQTTATRLSIGCSPWALDTQIDGHIRRVQYWPRVLSNTELQQVTR